MDINDYVDIFVQKTKLIAEILKVKTKELSKTVIKMWLASVSICKWILLIELSSTVYSSNRAHIRIGSGCLKQWFPPF